MSKNDSRHQYLIVWYRRFQSHSIFTHQKNKFIQVVEDPTMEISAWNLPTCGCKSMMEGLTIMLGVFINLLYTYTLPNNHYSTTYMLPYPHLMAKHCLKVGRKSRSEAWNLPTSGCKSMMEGLTIMLGVFITLLYINIMPNKHYRSKPTSLRYHLMAKRCLKAGRKSKSEA